MVHKPGRDLVMPDYTPIRDTSNMLPPSPPPVGPPLPPAPDGQPSGTVTHADAQGNPYMMSAPGTVQDVKGLYESQFGVPLSAAPKGTGISHDDLGNATGMRAPIPEPEARRTAATGQLPKTSSAKTSELKSEHLEARRILAEKIAQAGMSPKQLEAALVAQFEKAADGSATAELLKQVGSRIGKGTYYALAGLPPALGLYAGWLSERRIQPQDLKSIREKSLMDEYSKAIDTLREQQGYTLEGTRQHREDEERRQARRRKNLLKGLAIGVPTAAAGYMGYKALSGDKPTA